MKCKTIKSIVVIDVHTPVHIVHIINNLNLLYICVTLYEGY